MKIFFPNYYGDTEIFFCPNNMLFTTQNSLFGYLLDVS